MGPDAFGLDDPGVAERGFAPGLAPVDEQHRPPALLEMDGDGDADNAGAEDNNISHWITPAGSPSTSHFGVTPSPGAVDAVIRPLTRFGAPSAISTVP